MSSVVVRYFIYIIFIGRHTTPIRLQKSDLSTDKKMWVVSLWHVTWRKIPHTSFVVMWAYKCPAGELYIMNRENYRSPTLICMVEVTYLDLLSRHDPFRFVLPFFLLLFACTPASHLSTPIKRLWDAFQNRSTSKSMRKLDICIYHIISISLYVIWPWVWSVIVCGYIYIES
jgi:hypothetical protein